MAPLNYLAIGVGIALCIGCAPPQKPHRADTDLQQTPLSEELAPIRCHGGCSVKPPQSKPDEEIAALLHEVAGEPYGKASKALETLLFHADSTRNYLAHHAGEILDAKREAFVLRELHRTYAIVEMRMVDEHGVVRAELAASRVPFGKKQHLVFSDYDRLQPFEASGTVVRVGLGHIWTRY